MKIIAIMGSPRAGGNTDTILEAFLQGAREEGSRIEKIAVGDLVVSPCRACLNCEATGRCVISDDVPAVFKKLSEVDKIVIASPIFFYGLPAQLKALIDRGQTLWARTHVLGMELKGAPRPAFVLLLGATGGEKLFDGALLTLRYFLRPLNTSIVGTLLFRRIERKGAVQKHPSALKDAYKAGREFLGG